eukprot:TRINITY_DN1857_c0_g1_i1.p1 TRINITY_DN1857_c0_g1~~TRINITY_DN1857_c0_g1_i1.p1  ORF type:complete len:334 (-),score=89.98 TRINITY_DN1857_c0_g1_i1:29-1030(-)
MEVWVQNLSGNHERFTWNRCSVTAAQIWEDVSSRFGIPQNELRFTINSKELNEPTRIFTLEDIETLPPIRTSLRLLGGKGGFGALLRGAGAKIGTKKTANFDDCRDLNGRRIRHVKDQKRLEEWQAQEKERALEAEAKKDKKKKKAPIHVFNDSSYTEAVKDIAENTEVAVEEGIKRLIEQSSMPVVEEKPVKRRKKSIFDDYGYDSSEDEQSSPTSSKEEVETSPQPSTEIAESIPISTPVPEKSDPISEAIADAVTEAIASKSEESDVIDLMKFDSAQSLESIGNDRLKEELKQRGLLFGGNLQQKAARLYQTKGLRWDEIPNNLKQKDKR